MRLLVYNIRDFILHRPDIRSVDFWIPHVTHSDHLPLVWDFALAAGGTT